MEGWPILLVAAAALFGGMYVARRLLLGRESAADGLTARQCVRIECRAVNRSEARFCRRCGAALR